MTNAVKKHRRWMHSTGKQIIKIVKTQKKYCPILVIPKLNYFSWSDRFKSLFNPKREELPKQINYKNRQMILAK